MNLIGGDWRYFWNETLRELAILPQAWDTSLNTGIGQPAIGTMWIVSYLNFTAAMASIGIPWLFISIFFWLLPAILLSAVSGYFIVHTLISKRRLLCGVGSLIYASNTYFLLIALGGQFGVALAYSILPIVYLSFRNLWNKPTITHSLIFGLISSLQILFDPRLFVLVLVPITLHVLFYFSRKNFFRKMRSMLLSVLLVIFIHSFWVLPLIFANSTTVIPKQVSANNFAQFFSFAMFENSISLLHPNWPENLFGKTAFMRPEFLILPLIAFSGLLKFRNAKYPRELLLLATLAIFASFMAKGTQDPFGQIYQFFYDTIPGFVMYRDPLKWYVLISLSYAVLIPFSLLSLKDLIDRKLSIIYKKVNLPAIVFCFVWLLLIRNIFLGETKNMVHIKPIPSEYVSLKKHLQSDDEFFRTLWIPEWQRLGYFSNNHPAIGRYELIPHSESSSSGLLINLEHEMLNSLQELSVKYVIVPFDSQGEIFLEDRKYSERVYQETVDSIREINYLNDIEGFGRIKVFEVPDPKDHFYLNGLQGNVEYTYVTPTEYSVTLNDVNKGDSLIFSERFDENWEMRLNGQVVVSKQYIDLLNSFELPKSGTYSATIYYTPQDWVNRGLVVSGVTFISIIGILIWSYRKKK